MQRGQPAEQEVGGGKRGQALQPGRRRGGPAQDAGGQGGPAQDAGGQGGPAQDAGGWGGLSDQPEPHPPGCHFAFLLGGGAQTPVQDPKQTRGPWPALLCPGPHSDPGPPPHRRSEAWMTQVHCGMGPHPPWDLQSKPHDTGGPRSTRAQGLFLNQGNSRCSWSGCCSEISSAAVSEHHRRTTPRSGW